jgi:hypothetical protein
MTGVPGPAKQRLNPPENHGYATGTTRRARERGSYRRLRGVAHRRRRDVVNSEPTTLARNSRGASQNLWVARLRPPHNNPGEAPRHHDRTPVAGAMEFTRGGALFSHTAPRNGDLISRFPEMVPGLIMWKGQSPSPRRVWIRRSREFWFGSVTVTSIENAGSDELGRTVPQRHGCHSTSERGDHVRGGYNCPTFSVGRDRHRGIAQSTRRLLRWIRWSRPPQVGDGADHAGPMCKWLRPDWAAQEGTRWAENLEIRPMTRSVVFFSFYFSLPFSI